MLKNNTPRKYDKDLIYGKNQISWINSCFCYANCILKIMEPKKKFYDLSLSPKDLLIIKILIVVIMKFYIIKLLTISQWLKIFSN